MTRTAKLFVLLAALAGMLLLPAACLALRYFGPAARVMYFDYLPIEELAIAVAAAVLGASLAATGARAVLRPQPTAAPVLRFAALALLLAWIGGVQLFAFPAAAGVAKREAWARARLPQYAALKRVVAAVPEVQRDVGKLVALAPTSNDEHRAAREMNGDDMHFALDVVGERGRGVFYVDCTLDEFRVYDWRPGRWLFDGRAERIERVPERVPGD
ncbi:MAG TPA: hypothetical protein VJR89_06650 [Polyangiales bacterium]|nr:hypothetical protein [Polyangiales bacterium]